MAVQRSTHPSADLLKAFGLGKLDESSSGVVMNHVDRCDECRDKVTALSGDDFLQRLRQAHSRSNTPAPAKSLAEVARAPKPSDRPTPIPNLPPELAANQQYEILRELGRGGMGVVYLAHNKLMDRLEVLKVVNKALLEHPGAVERFLREIRAAAKLNHANVVAAYSAVQQGELLAFAMEYVEGQDLASLVKTQGPLPIAHACYYVQQAALGLQHAYEKQMVHRDIKPQNLILAREAKKHTVKVLDFGLAKVLREKTDDTGLTGEGKMLGTPDYVAPEQTLDAAKADIRADVYSLGCTLYYLLSGCPPFSANSLGAILLAHQMQEAKSLNLVRPEVPEELAAVVRKMMAKSPAQRYQTPREVAQALAPFIKSGAESKQAPELSVEAAELRPPVKKKTGTARPTAATQMPAEPEVIKKTPPKTEIPAAEPRRSERFSDVTIGSVLGQNIPAAAPRKKKTARKGQSAAAMSLRRKKWVIASAISVGVLFLTLVGLWASGVFKVKTKEGILEPKQTRDGNNLPPPIVVSSNEYDLSGGFRVVHFGKEGTRGLPVLVDTKQKKYFTQVYDLVTGQAITPSLSHEGRIVHLAFSPDGRRVVTASEDKTARLWDAINGQALAPPLQHGDIVLRASFSPDGRRVVTASEDKTARVWDAATGQALTPPLLHGDKVRHASFSPDGRRVVTASEDKTARLWDAATGKEMASLFQHKSGVAHASFSPDGQRVVTAGWDATARLWDAVTGREATPPLQHTSVVRHASFSPDGRRVVTASKDKTARLWDAATGKQVTPPLQHEDGLLRASFSPDGQQVVTSSQDQTARVWDAATGQAVTPPLLHEGPVYCAMFSPDGRRVVTACLNTTWRSLGVANVRLWDVTTGKELKKTTLDPEGDHAAEDEGFVPLFNGKDLTGWKTYPDNPGNWRVDNRILIGRGPTKSLLFTQKNTYRDFHLRAIARINSGGDSGLCFRIPMFDYRKGQVKGKGYEAQINNTTGKGNYPLTGSLMHFPGAAVTNTLVPPGEWFTLEVLAEGHHFIIRIDGKKTVDFIDSKQSYQRGHLAVNVMDPSTVVEFLKIEIKELASAATMASLSEGSVWKGKRTYRKGAWAGATVTYELHISKCDGSKFKGVKFDNGPGRNRGDVEGEIHGDVIAWREHGLSFKGTLRANEIHVRFDGPVGNGWTTEGDGTLTLSK